MGFTGFCLRILLDTIIFHIFQLGSWSKRYVKPLKLSREAIWQVSGDPYHTKFVSWHIEHFSFFFPLRGGGGWGPILSGKFHYFLFCFWPLPLMIFQDLECFQSFWPYRIKQINILDFRFFVVIILDYIKITLTK